jgi:hypothetical protein
MAMEQFNLNEMRAHDSPRDFPNCPLRFWLGFEENSSWRMLGDDKLGQV